MAYNTRASTRRSMITPPPNEPLYSTKNLNKKKKAPSLVNLIPPAPPFPDPSGKTKQSAGISQEKYPRVRVPRQPKAPSESQPHSSVIQSRQRAPSNPSAQVHPRKSSASGLEPNNHHRTPHSQDSLDISIPNAAPLSDEGSSNSLSSGNSSTSDALQSVSGSQAHASACQLPSTYTDAQHIELEAIVAAIPSDLLFFLSPQPSWRKATIKKLLRIIQLVSGDYYIDNKHIHVDHINVRHFDPNQRASTKAIISALIHKVSPEIRTTNLNKDTLVSIFYKVYNLDPAEPHRKFTVVPPPLGKPNHEEQERNNVRFALQAYYPSLYICVECTLPQLLALYEIYMLDDLTCSHLVREYVHYSWFNPFIPPKYVYRPGKLLNYQTVSRHQLKDRIAPPPRNVRQPASINVPIPRITRIAPQPQDVWQTSLINLPLPRPPLPSQLQVAPSPHQVIPSSCAINLDRNPSIIHAMVSAAVLFLFEQVPARAVECQLQSTFDLITPFLLAPSPDAPIEPEAIPKLPRKINTLMSALGLNCKLTHLISCPACFATYPIDNAPPLCTSTLTDGLAHHPASCGASLFIKQVPKPVPCRQFSFQSLPSWLAGFLSRPGIEDLLDQSLVASQEDYNPARVRDIHESFQWKNFQGTDGRPFTAQSGNLSFGMFIDGINPYGNKQAGKHASITFIVLVCLTLPITHCFLPQNIYLVSIAPGPKEPSLTQTNWLLDPLVKDLKTLWSPGLLLSSTFRHHEGRHIKYALMPFFADLPACRCTLGLAGHASHEHMCSKCQLTKDQIHCFDIHLLRKRCDTQNQRNAISARDAGSYTARQRIYNHLPPNRRPQTPPNQEGVEENDHPDNNTEENHTDDSMEFLDISFQSTDPEDEDYLVPVEELEISITSAIFDSDLLAYKDLPHSLSSLITNVMKTQPAPTDLDSKTTRLSYQPSLSDHVLKLLVEQINMIGPPNHLPSDQYHQLTRANRNSFHPINGKHTPLKQYRNGDITYSTSEANSRNSLVKLDDTGFADCHRFGFIENIFVHSYRTANKVRKTHTWFVIKPLQPIPQSLKNPFRELKSPAMQIDL
ncbi:hypothetical protein MJO28_005541 [Puccinia striiformis f. sp. tritici]|uniref:Uncharacterized protein n=1 Tax=Puccinia striiformis f. sp. tritici TaxID=168172 RepID=A0ACC0EKM0_9BASI|nr:hypothetical protein MJO28_005541 [Puccinia striiformis f. sp. tritici]